jgi:hypothetical protein
MLFRMASIPIATPYHPVKFYLECWNEKNVVITTLLKSSFVSIRLFSATAWRMTPPSSPEGEAAQGEHPSDPLFFLGYVSTL